VPAADQRLIEEIRSRLAEAGDPERAAAQQAYMKSRLPYRGIGAPALRTLLRPVLAPYSPPDRATHEATVRALWDGVTWREEWYAALAVARHRRARDWVDAGSLPLWRHLVVTGGWWDVVDEIAGHLVGSALHRDRPEVGPVMLEWSVDPDPWLRRTSVLCQLRHGPDTDTALLAAVVERNVDDPSFWLRKAIGWALRQYARTDPDWVRAEVATLDGRLSGLSRREALKHL
jgi:3-methyladenine DNA glycosylase AlkD